MVTRPSDERGQLLLIGAVAIALVVVGGVVLLNGMKYTDTVGTSGTDDAISDSERTVEMVESDLEGLVERVGSDTSLLTFEDRLKENVSQMSRVYTRMAVDRRSAYVNISVNTTASGSGWLLNQSVKGQFEDDDGNQRWTVVSDATVVEPFLVTVDEWPESTGGGSGSKESALYINVTGDDGHWWSLKLNDSDTSPTVAKQITVYTDRGRQETISEGNISGLGGSGPYAIDIPRGEINTTATAEPVGGLWTFAENVSAPYNISFRDEFPGSGGGGGEKSAKGRYLIATDGGASDEIPDGVNTTELSVFHPAFDIYYHQPEVQYTRTVSVTYHPEADTDD